MNFDRETLKMAYTAGYFDALRVMTAKLISNQDTMLTIEEADSYFTDFYFDLLSKAGLEEEKK